MSKAQREKAIQDVSPMTERDLTRCVVDAAKECGWLVYHTFLSKWSKPGFPDLTLCHPERHKLMFLELKSAKGKVSEPQQGWLDALAAVPGVEARVIRSDDLEDAYRRLAGQMTKAEEEFEASLPKPGDIRGLWKEEP